MSVKAVYYSGDDKIYEITAYKGFNHEKMILAGNNLENEEGVFIDSIEIVEDKDSNVIQTWKKNFLNEWYVDCIIDIEKNYSEYMQTIEGFDSCIVGVITIDNQEFILYDTELIKSQMLRGDKATEINIDFAMQELQRNYNECAFTDYPAKWLRTV